MTVKEYLCQAQYLDGHITELQSELDALRKLPTSAKRISELDKIINDEIDRYVDVKIGIHVLIARLDGMNKNIATNVKIKLVFQKRYIGFMTWERIAEDMDCTYQWVNELHGMGLIYLQKYHELLDTY